MERITTPIEHDVFLAAISVVPAAILWIGMDQLYLGLALGAGIFLTAEYGYPAYKEGRLDLSAIRAFAANARESIRSRVTKSA